LSQYAAVARPDWTFAPTVYGRPFLTNDDDLARRISFNISHSEDRIVVAIAIDRLLGVDVERVMPIEDMEEVAKAFFSPQEVQALRGLPLAQRNARFLEYWTLKESYIKACGQGLSLPLDKFWFQFPQAGTLQFNISNDLDADAQRWLFWQIESVPDYLVAVCSNHGPSRIPEIMMRSYVPLLGEQQPIHGTVVRISAV
jgi:4'-phosphopantetheinyl transferase